MIKHTFILAFSIFLFSCSGSGEKITKEMMLSFSDEFTKSFETRSITFDVISTSIDTKINQGTIEEKFTTKVFIEEAEATIESMSLSKTTYGYINNQVKIVESSYN